MTRLVRAVVVIGCAVAGLSALEAQTPILRIIHPTDREYLIGPSDLVAEVAPNPAGAVEVTFFVDGTQVCRTASRPFRCSFDAGNRGATRTVRVTALLADGTRLVKTVRSMGLDLSQSSSVEAVLVPVHVSDDRGSLVEGLKASQFRLIEDGVPQTISGFLAEEAAVSVLLALDISGSMTPAVTELRAAAGGFLQSLRPTDQITLAGFNNGLFLLAPPTAGPAALLAALDRLRPFGKTALFDSMIRAADLLRPEPAPRALVVFTDGDDISSLATVEGVRAALQTQDVLLYMIGQGKAEQNRELRTRLTSLAVETGGAAYFSSRMSSLRGHFADIVNDLSHQYLLSYVPLRDLGDGGWRKIDVQVQAGPVKVSVRARQGYLAVRRSGGGRP